MTFKIKKIDNCQRKLKEVRDLWRSESATLGFFPNGAFTDYAGKGQIIVALDKTGKCLGYLLFRISNESASIVHLCVKKSMQRNGIARSLCEELFETTKSLKRIGLWCRRDYPAANIWQELGFVALADKPGRGRERVELTFWKRDHDHPKLFQNIPNVDEELKLHVAIDANVLFDLCDQELIKGEESRSLLADWLSPFLELCVTDEILNEINRRIQPEGRDRSRKFAQTFQILSPTHTQWESKYDEILNLLPKKMTEQDKSDYRHLAKALSSDVQFFITRDGPLLKKADHLYKDFGLSILRPSDLVIYFNDLIRETAYQPVRFDRTTFQKRHIKAGEVSNLTEIFQHSTHGERKTEFQQTLGNLLAYPDKYESLLITDQNANPVALISFDRETNDNLRVPLLRLKRGSLSRTIAKNLVQKTLTIAANENRTIIRITDSYLDEYCQEALKENRFHLDNNYWIKFSLPVVMGLAELSGRLATLPLISEQENTYRRDLTQGFNVAQGVGNEAIAAELELLLWPAKITDLEIPSYIVPIKPRWAQELFDEELAAQNLFGSPPELGLSVEAVYYRARSPSNGLAASSRILWYVSTDKNFHGSMYVRACSYIDEVVVGKPKDLYRRYRRLGVYDWKNIFELAKYDVSNQIMAIKFSNTELFSYPVSWPTLQDILKKGKCPSRIQSPHRVTSDVFMQIYRIGTNRQVKEQNK